MTMEEITCRWRVGHLSFMRAIALPNFDTEKSVPDLSHAFDAPSKLKDQEQTYLVRTGKIKSKNPETRSGAMEQDTYVICSGRKEARIDGLQNARCCDGCLMVDEEPKFMRPEARLIYEDFLGDPSELGDLHGSYTKYFLALDPEIQNGKLLTIEDMIEMIYDPGVAFDLEDVIGYDSRYV